MAFVITESCVDSCDASCTQVCPVFCIQGPAPLPMEEKPQENLGLQRFINPEKCVDCGHCVAECPVDAIYLEEEVPSKWQSYIQKNAAFFSSPPAETPTTTPMTPKAPEITVPAATPAVTQTEALRTQAPHSPTITITNPVEIDHTQELPIWEGQKTPLFVAEIIEETIDSRTFRFQGKPLCQFVYKAGQFCTLVLNIDGKKVLRSYTISSTPSRPFTLDITVKRVPGGLVSNWLIDHLKVGDPIQIAGPKGKFCLHPGKIPKKLLFISAGSGVTPMMAMSRWICDVCADVDIKFFNSARTPDDIIFRKELEMLTASYKAFSPIITTTSRESTSEWMGFRGRVSRQMLEFSSPDIHERHIFMCGPNPFMNAVKELLKEMNFNMAQLHLESFGGVRTAKANKNRPVQAVHVADPAHSVKETPQPAGQSFQIQFEKSQKTIQSNDSTPLLDLAEENDIDIDYSCRSGCCGECKVRLLKGTVEQESDDALDDEEKAAGYILTCVATPTSNCTLDT